MRTRSFGQATMQELIFLIFPIDDDTVKSSRTGSAIESMSDGIWTWSNHWFHKKLAVALIAQVLKAGR